MQQRKNSATTNAESKNSSWGGFWSRPDRGQAWAAAARCCNETWQGYVRISERLGMIHPELHRMKMTAAWMTARASKYGWRPTYTAAELFPAELHMSGT